MPDRDEYTYEAHDFNLRLGGKVYCSKCGLFVLNNPLTDWAVRMGCNHRDHPSYDNKRYNTTKLPGF